MKCLVCSAETPPPATTCPHCGEASWAPEEPVRAEHEEVKEADE